MSMELNDRHKNMIHGFIKRVTTFSEGFLTNPNQFDRRIAGLLVQESSRLIEILQKDARVDEEDCLIIEPSTDNIAKTAACKVTNGDRRTTVESKNEGKGKRRSEASNEKSSKKLCIQDDKNKHVILEDSDDDDVILIKAAGHESTAQGKEMKQEEPCHIRSLNTHSIRHSKTKYALKREKQRLKRVEKQQIHHLHNPDKCKIYLDSGNELMVDRKIACVLKDHQIQGIKFMWSSTYENIKSTKKTNSGNGCILAHCMGLGKSLSCIALVHTLLTHSELTKTKRVLILTPVNALLNWVHEFQYWLKDCDESLNLFNLTGIKCDKKRLFAIKNWYIDGGVFIIGYKLCTQLMKKNTLFAKYLFKPDLVICDEGHVLKNQNTEIFKWLDKVITKRRIALTGSPLHNNFMDYYSMVSFVKPNILGTIREFRNCFEAPISLGQRSHSTESDVLFMKKRVHCLNKLLSGFVQRIDYSIIGPLLPPKKEFVISINLSHTQRELYETYLKQTDVKRKANRFFANFLNLYSIWTHPVILQMTSGKNVSIKRQFREFFGGVTTDDEDSNQSDEFTHSVKRHDGHNSTGNTDAWWSKTVNGQLQFDKSQSGKIAILGEIIEKCQEVGDKLLVFSHSLHSLDLIEKFLQHWSTGKCKWHHGVDYFRMNGSTPIMTRANFIQEFNRSGSPSRLFLISTRAGGIGVDLVGANRAVLFDASWNPVHELQSIFRIYRFGQQKPVYIYRFLAKGTMEEKIYGRQIIKQSLPLRVADQHQLDRHFTSKELKELYDFSPDCLDEAQKTKEVSTIPGDTLMAGLLESCGQWISTYHDHNSLLENRLDESLSAEERTAAWNEFELEKNDPPFA